MFVETGREIDRRMKASEYELKEKDSSRMLTWENAVHSRSKSVENDNKFIKEVKELNQIKMSK